MKHAGEDGGSPNHAMDNIDGYYDFALFDFGAAGDWRITEMEIGWSLEDGGQKPEVDLYRWSGSSAPTMSSIDLGAWDFVQ